MSNSEFIFEKSRQIFVRKEKVKGPYRVCKVGESTGRGLIYKNDGSILDFLIKDNRMLPTGIILLYDKDMNLVYCNNYLYKFHYHLSCVFEEDKINSAYMKNHENIYYISYIQCGNKSYERFYNEIYLNIYSPYLNFTQLNNLEYDDNNRIVANKYQALNVQENDEYIVINGLDFTDLIKIEERDIYNLPNEEVVYIFYNSKKEVMYVGSTVNLKRRFMQHLCGSNCASSKVYAARELSKENITYYKYAKVDIEYGYFFEELYQWMLLPKLENYSLKELERYKNKIV